ncbi:unnamed protein product [Rangifer tarandus platyrhynchus]|uniref:Uncharacterized protein n=2 Tax=Rangifer tarandus platyrhynchus TaxID=3082113 RepID=A0ACB0EDD4_RANTA|nr:unnamed protein product [Rangifer tarandus platyrhynchus]CAI9698264.1 unnamed protein product [Rangifer tarandus platyrhynchus]
MAHPLDGCVSAGSSARALGAGSSSRAPRHRSAPGPGPTPDPQARQFLGPNLQTAPGPVGGRGKPRTWECAGRWEERGCFGSFGEWLFREDVELWDLVGAWRQILGAGDVGVGRAVCSSGELGDDEESEGDPAGSRGAGGEDPAEERGRGKREAAGGAREGAAEGQAQPRPGRARARAPRGPAAPRPHGPRRVRSLPAPGSGLPPASTPRLLRSTAPALSQVRGPAAASLRAPPGARLAG